MLAVIKQETTKKPKKILNYGDIITVRFKDVTIYNDDGTRTITRQAEKVNITKKVNESKKLIKTYTAEDKLKEIDRIARA